MRAIARFLVACFFLQYYLTLACTVALTLAKRLLACLVQLKDRASIHPFHNTHQAVFEWMGNCFYSQRTLSGWTATPFRTFDSPQRISRKSTYGVSAGRTRLPTSPIPS
jgi:hypothetical protein